MEKIFFVGVRSIFVVFNVPTKNRFGTMKVSKMPLGNTKLRKKHRDFLFVTSSPCWVGDPPVHSPKQHVKLSGPGGQDFSHP